jgi:hypothetical protein
LDGLFKPNLKSGKKGRKNTEEEFIELPSQVSKIIGQQGYFKTKRE